MTPIRNRKSSLSLLREGNAGRAHIRRAAAIVRRRLRTGRGLPAVAGQSIYAALRAQVERVHGQVALRRQLSEG